MGRNRTREGAITTETSVTLLFVVLGMVLWYGSMAVTDNTLVQFALLFGVGVVVPTIINDRRSRR